MEAEETPKTTPNSNRRKTLRRGLKLGTRLLVYPLVVVATVVLAASVLLQTEAARNLLKDFVEKAVENRIQGQITVEKISGNLWFDISLENVRLFQREGPILSAGRVSATYFLPLLLARILYLHEVQIEGLSLNMVKSADGRWNVQTLLTQTKAETPDRIDLVPFKVIISRIALHDTSLKLTETRDNQSRTRSVNDLRLIAGLTVGAEPFLAANIMEMSFKTDQPGFAVDSLRGRLGYHLEKKQLTAGNLRIRSGGTDLSLNGMLGWRSGIPEVDLRSTIKIHSIGQTAKMLNLPAVGKGTLLASLHVQGKPNRFYHELELNLDRASLRTDGYVDDVLTEQMRIDISGALRQVSPQKLPLTVLKNINGEINCDFILKAANLVRSDRKGEIGLSLKRSNLYGFQIDQGNLQATFDQYRLVLKEGRLSGPPGSIQFHSAQAEIFDSKRSRKFNLNASCKDVDLEKITGRPDLSGKMNLDIQAFAEFQALRQAATDAGRISVQVDTKINPSNIMGIDIANGRLISSWDGNQLKLQEFDVSSDVGRLTLSGNALPDTWSGQIEYCLTVPHLEKAVLLLTPLIPKTKRSVFEQKQLSGSVAISGELSGRWDQPILSARITGNEIAYGDFSAGGVQVTADWQGDVKQFNLAATTKFQNFSIDRFGLSGADIMLKLSPAKADLDISMTDEKKATARIVGQIQGWALPQKTVTINHVNLSFAEDGRIGRVFKTIASQKPMYMTISKGVLDVSAFELVSDRSTLSLTGNLAPNGRLKTRVVLNTIDLQGVTQLWYHNDSISGILSAEIEISGSLAQPVIQAVLNVENGSGHDFSFSKIGCTLDYRQDQVSFKATGFRNGSNLLDLNGKGNIGFSLVPFRIEPHPERFEISAQVNGIKLSTLPFAKPAGVSFDAVMTLKVSAAGDLGTPMIKGKLSLEDGWFSSEDVLAEKVTFRNLDLDFNYQNARAWVDAALYQEDRKTLDIKGEIGLLLSLVPFRLVPAEKDMQLHLNVLDLQLAQLPFPKPAGLNLDGVLNLDVSASESISRPVIDGRLTIRNGYLSLPGRQLDYKDMSADIAFSRQKITITRFELKGDKEGHITCEGEIETKGLKPSAFNIRLNGENVYIPYKPSVYARVQPELTFSGGLDSPQLTGTLSVTESRIDIDQLTQTGPVEIQIDTGQPDDARPGLLNERQSAGSEFIHVLKADVVIDVPRNAWLKGQGLNVEIAGKLNLKKVSTKPFTLIGSLNTVRGTYTFQGKLFKMTQGNIDFVGLEEPNPNLDIEATTRIKKVDIKLKVSGTARDMRLSLDSDPPMEQSDIIAYLVFGRSVSDLNNQQSFNAEQAALNITGQMAANELKNILGDAFLLDTLTLESEGEDIRQGAVSAGKYVSPEVFVLYRHRFKTDEPDQIEVTYELNRNFSIQTQLSDEASSGIDFVWEFDF